MSDNLTIDFVDQQKPAAPQGLQIDFVDQPKQRAASGILESAQAGYQGSGTGLIARGKLPDVVLDPQHAKWYEKLAAGASQLVSEAPQMIVGAVGGGVAGGAAGTAVPVVGNVAGGVVGAGAGAFALPTAIRESLMQAYSKGDVQSAADFLSRASIVLKATGKDALIGALTGGAGAAASKVVAPVLGEAAMAGKIGATTARVGTDAATVGAEIGTMTVAPAALEGHLPQPEDFANAAILVAGLKGAGVAASRLRKVYAETGRRPEEVVSDAQKDPSIAEDLNAPAVEGEAAPRAAEGEGVTGTADIPRAYQDEAIANRAADIVPGVKTEQVRNEPFGPVTQAAGEPATPTEINYNYMHTPDDAKAALARLSTVYEAEIQTQRRGTVSWEQTQAEAGQHIADLLGSTEPFQPRTPGAAAGAAELLARKQMLQGAAEDMAVKAREYLATPEELRTPMQTAEYLASIERAAMIQSEFLGARAEAGRALNILKDTKLDAARAEHINDLISRYGHSPEDLARMVSELDNPTAALKFAKEANKATTWEKLIEAWKAGLVSGPVTQVANIMGNLSFAAMRPAVDAVAASIGMLTRAPDRVTFVEPLARVLGNIQGTFNGMRMARVAFMEDIPAGKADQFKGTIEGTTGYIVRTPFRALSAMDALFRNMAEQGEAYAIATRQASKEGYNPATSEFSQRVVEISNDLTPEQAKAVEATGERLVFQSPLGEKGRAVQDFVKTWHLEWAVPFISTPANVFKEMARLSPAAPIVGEWRAAVAKGGPEAQKAFAEMAIGTGISAMTMSWALSGNISGSGDPDPNKRRAQMAAGWQPYSIKINDTWYSYQRVQPIGTLMGMAADMASVWEHMSPAESDKLPKIMATAFANAVTNQTFLQGMTSVVQVMADPQRYGPKFINGLAGSVVPAAIGQTAQMIDPYQREISSALEAIKNRIPGLRESLTPTRDIFGAPQANPDRLGGISPITERTLSEDPVRKEAARLGVGAPEAPKAIELPAGGDTKLGKVVLTQQQRDVFGDVSGHLAHDIMTPMVNSPGWSYMPDFVKQKAFKLVFEKSHEAGKAAALTDGQRQQEIQRITTEIGKRLAQ